MHDEWIWIRKYANSIISYSKSCASTNLTEYRDCLLSENKTLNISTTRIIVYRDKSRVVKLSYSMNIKKKDIIFEIEQIWSTNT